MSQRASLKSQLPGRFRATLLGAGVGNALGFPHGGSSRTFLVALGGEVIDSYEKHRSGYHPPGQYSLDMQLLLGTLRALVSAGDLEVQKVVDEWLPLWRENRVLRRPPELEGPMRALMSNPSGWQNSANEPGISGNDTILCAVASGLWNYDEPDRLVEQALEIASITHEDPGVRGVHCALAAAIAYNLTHQDLILGEFIDTVAGIAESVDAVLGDQIRGLPLLLTQNEDEAFERLLSLAGGSRSQPPVGIPPLAVPTLLSSFFYFLRSPGDVMETLHGCLLVGGAVDSVAAIGGALGGALQGDEGLSTSLVNGLLDGEMISRTGDRIYRLKEEERSRRND